MFLAEFWLTDRVRTTGYAQVSAQLVNRVVVNLGYQFKGALAFLYALTPVHVKPVHIGRDCHDAPLQRQVSLPLGDGKRLFQSLHPFFVPV